MIKKIIHIIVMSIFVLNILMLIVFEAIFFYIYNAYYDY